MFLKVLALSIAILLIFVGISKYMTYPAKTELIDEYLQKYLSTNKVSISNLDSTTLVFKGENVNAGLVFYPGGFVDYNSYKPLMASLASKGIMCILYKMPLNLAFLNIIAARGIKDKFPEIKNWYMGGHSLGGSCSSYYLYFKNKEFKGLILLGSYSTVDFSNTNLKVVSILGTEDKVINMERYNKYKANYPKDFIEIKIEGGCHSYFGMHGLMEKDGTPTISNIDQIEYTANELSKLI